MDLVIEYIIAVFWNLLWLFIGVIFVVIQMIEWWWRPLPFSKTQKIFVLAVALIVAQFLAYKSIKSKLNEINHKQQSMQKATGEKYKAIREGIAKLMDEGKMISERFHTLEPAQEILRLKAQWEKRVEQFLSNNLERSYATRFRNAGPHSASYPTAMRDNLKGSFGDMEAKISMLNTILSELYE